jgi:hypothetical protein
MNPAEIKLTGNAQFNANTTLLDFWRWAFSDLCDDDIKGIFAEWMVIKLLGLQRTRRISWADSDIILEDDTRIEVKATAVWQSWKLLDEYGKRRIVSPAILNPNQIRFCGLKARTAVLHPRPSEASQFKSKFYIFCFHSQLDPAAWDAWNLANWEFYMMSKTELTELKIGRSISLRTLRNCRPPMSAARFQEYAKSQLGL